ncbi:MAG: 2-octaprenyl-3-methyl-6-methoxy-1,4-benzoquinol hydroxylase [Salinisphaeraceae bacterium]|nr:2-octaprenyl-3-methyl-6-methoxy-1,4-benzoquinol hydroxylase [Salinisphaeraceae bacterium]
MSAPRHDVAVVGGGMVGAVLSVALEQAGFKVALIEAREPAPWSANDDYDLRVSAVSPASRNLLANLGLWDAVAAGRISPYRGMRVWERPGGPRLDFEHSALGLPELGHIIENNLIVTAAWNRMAAVRRYCPALLEALTVESDRVQLFLDSGETVEARLAIGAEGARSKVRDLAGMATRGWAYGQRCTVGTVTTERSHQAIAWQRFLPTGPVAFLPLADGRCSLAWHADDALAHTLSALDDSTFLDRLTEASDAALGQVTAVAARAAFPLQLQHAQEYVRPRLALIGDAAHVLHPMAGQGVNLGLMDIATLVDVLTRARDKSQDIGALRVLKRYQRPRRAENALMLGAVDGIQKLFAGSTGLLAELRNQGMASLNALSPLKQLMIQQATGFSGSPPPLLRPPGG